MFVSKILKIRHIFPCGYLHDGAHFRNVYLHLARVAGDCATGLYGAVGVAGTGDGKNVAWVALYHYSLIARIIKDALEFQECPLRAGISEYARLGGLSLPENISALAERTHRNTDRNRKNDRSDGEYGDER